MLLSLKLIRMTLNSKDSKKILTLKARDIESWKTKTQEYKNLLFPKK